jgi:hypothetical protein
MIQKIKNILDSIAERVDTNLAKTSWGEERYHILIPVWLCITFYGVSIGAVWVSVTAITRTNGDELVNLLLATHSAFIGMVCLWGAFKSAYSIGVHIHRRQVAKELLLEAQAKEERERIAFVITDIEGSE